MLNWIRRQARKPARSGRTHSYRPRVEGLEDRCLLTVAITAIPSQNVPQGRTLIVPVAATDSAGNPLTYTVTSSNSSQVNAQVLTGNTFMKITVAGFGNMVFELFNDLAPNTVAEITTLVNKGFYNGLTFHRVIPNFVIQGGDPKGDGTGGPGFTFANEFNADLIYSGNGQLAMANSGPDTNGSQFFVTIGPQPGLDFDNPIFGQLVQGFDVRDKIANVARDSMDKPITPVVMSSVSIIQDTSDAVLLLSASPSATSATITVKATATDGTDTKIFSATAGPYTNQSTGKLVDDPPFLNPLPNQTTTPNTPVTFTVSATNLQNDQLTFEAIPQGSPANATATVGSKVTNNSTTVTVTPKPGFIGSVQILVGVEKTGATSRGNDNFAFDTHVITVNVTGDRNTLYVQTLYQDILGRPAETGGLNFWVGALASGQLNRRLVANEIARSPEAYSRDIQQAYQTILGRAADQLGFSGALSYLENGGNLQHLEAKLAGSLEFWTNKGQSMIGPYMNALYQAALGRNADPAGVNGAIFLITKHFTLTDIAYVVYSSPEADQDLLNGFYQNFLGRAPDSAGQQSFLAEFKAGTDQLEIEAEILGSDEFFSKVS
jgi:cyclophilin family peptidyl-prolyl cis-trans isomerase